jgi:hypothetical protein
VQIWVTKRRLDNASLMDSHLLHGSAHVQISFGTTRKHYFVGSFIPIVPDNVFACVIWPLVVDHLNDFKAMAFLWEARLI